MKGYIGMVWKMLWEDSRIDGLDSANTCEGGFLDSEAVGPLQADQQSPSNK